MAHLQLDYLNSAFSLCMLRYCTYDYVQSDILNIATLSAPTDGQCKEGFLNLIFFLFLWDFPSCEISLSVRFLFVRISRVSLPPPPLLQFSCLPAERVNRNVIFSLYFSARDCWTKLPSSQPMALPEPQWACAKDYGTLSHKSRKYPSPSEKRGINLYCFTAGLENISLFIWFMYIIFLALICPYLTLPWVSVPLKLKIVAFWVLWKLHQACCPVGSPVCSGMFSAQTLCMLCAIPPAQSSSQLCTAVRYSWVAECTVSGKTSRLQSP